MDIGVATVSERDIDLLLLEEFSIDPRFLSWFLGTVGVDHTGELIAAQQSVATANGESDLELSVRTPEGDVRVLIENKVDAVLQPRQAERYAERGRSYLSSGTCARVVIVLIAPRKYLDARRNTAEFDAFLSYEEVLAWLTRRPSPRTPFKTMLLTKAIDKSASGYVQIPDERATAFWVEYWNLAREMAPTLEMPAPGSKPAQSTWIHFRPGSFPAGLQVIHKLPRGRVDLEVAGGAEALPDLKPQLDAVLGEGMYVTKAGKSLAVRVDVPIVDILQPFNDSIDDVRIGIAAAARLVQWYSESGRTVLSAPTRQH